MLKKLRNAWQRTWDFFAGSFWKQALLLSVGCVVVFAFSWLLVPASMGAMTSEGAGLFLVATMESFNIFSAMNSSPWTAENFGADEAKAKSCRKYVWLSVAANELLGVGVALLTMTAWPILGVTFASAFMYVLYQEALRKGKAAGSVGWANQPEVLTA